MISSGGVYRCKRDRGGCGAISINRPYTDEDIINRVQAVIDGGRLPQSKEVNDGIAALEAQVAALEQRRDAMYEDYMAGGSSLDDWKKTKAIADRRIAEVGAELRKHAERTARRRARAEILDLAGRFAELSVDEKRRLLDALIERIVVGRGVRGRNGYDPTRAEVTWR